jgi:hypothetical protein
VSSVPFSRDDYAVKERPGLGFRLLINERPIGRCHDREDGDKAEQEDKAGRKNKAPIDRAFGMHEVV